ncbi:MAG: precorrin-3B C(17)-methyltransferase [Spirochaetia bacterium]|nr:precorrin-3B C(17)-methyltransferase [Spirochaetia bacterium]
MQSEDKRKGLLSIVSTGPGNIQQLTPAALKAIARAEYIIGNNVYIDLIRPLIAGKEVVKSPMGEEVNRAQMAIDLAAAHRVAMVSGGDAGVYGMAGIVIEVAERTGSPVEIEVIPGVTAATAAASCLGSPLSGDYVTILLSDLLTPWDVIEERLGHAFAMGVPVAIYNPRSRGRPHNLDAALAIAAKHRGQETPVGVVKNAYRPDEERHIMTLGVLQSDTSKVDMHSIVIIGGLESRIWKVGDDVRGIITPRGYHRKYVY